MKETLSHSQTESARFFFKDILWIVLIALAVFVIDLLTKIWAVLYIEDSPPIEIIPGFLRLVYGENTGIAFGLFQNYGGILHILSPIAFVILLVIIYKQLSETPLDMWSLFMFGLLIGGAMGNILNRLYSGYVIDFIDVYIGQYQWPTFNIADTALTIGEVILIGKLLFWRKSAQEETSQEESKSSVKEGA